MRLKLTRKPKEALARGMECLRLHEEENLKYAEIAKRLGYSAADGAWRAAERARKAEAEDFGKPVVWPSILAKAPGALAVPPGRCPRPGCGGTLASRDAEGWPYCTSCGRFFPQKMPH